MSIKPTATHSTITFEDIDFSNFKKLGEDKSSTDERAQAVAKEHLHKK